MKFGKHRLYTVLVVGLFAGALAVVVPVMYFINGNTFDPLGEYPQQQVQDPIDENGNGLPEVVLGQPVPITAVKCNDSNTRWRIVGEWTWRLEDLDSNEIQVFTGGAGDSFREPGCKASTYSNKPPDEVTESLELSLLAGRKIHVSIVGRETPLDCDVREAEHCLGAHGVPRYWSTQQFEFVLPSD